jgi:hypothetical protein
LLKLNDSSCRDLDMRPKHSGFSIMNSDQKIIIENGETPQKQLDAVLEKYSRTEDPSPVK